MTRYDQFLIAGVILVFVLAYFADAQQQPAEQPRYLHFRGNHTMGDHYHEHPCEFGASLYEGGVYVGEPDAFPRFDDLIIDWQGKTVHLLYFRDYGTVLYNWHDFSLGTDGHTHPLGAWLVDCRFRN